MQLYALNAPCSPPPPIHPHLRLKTASVTFRFLPSALLEATAFQAQHLAPSAPALRLAASRNRPDPQLRAPLAPSRHPEDPRSRSLSPQAGRPRPSSPGHRTAGLQSLEAQCLLWAAAGAPERPPVPAPPYPYWPVVLPEVVDHSLFTLPGTQWRSDGTTPPGSDWVQLPSGGCKARLLATMNCLIFSSGE